MECGFSTVKQDCNNAMICPLAALGAFTDHAYLRVQTRDIFFNIYAKQSQNACNKMTCVFLRANMCGR